MTYQWSTEPIEQRPPPEARDVGEERDWRLRDLAIGLAVLVGALIVVFGTVTLYVAFAGLTEDNEDPGPLAIAITIAFEVIFGLAVVVLARRRGLSAAQVGFVPPRSWSPLPVAVVGAYASLAAYTLALEALEDRGIDVSGLDEGNPVPIGEDPSTRFLVLVGVAVLLVAPFAEELFFRSLAFGALRRAWGVPLALVVSGVLFGVFHLNPSVIVPFSLIGMVFAWAYWQSGSLWITIGAHLTVNGISYVASVWMALD